METDESLQGFAQYEGISSKNLQSLAANTAALTDEVITNTNNFHADDNRPQETNAGDGTGVVAVALVDTAAPTFEAIELLDEMATRHQQI